MSTINNERESVHSWMRLSNELKRRKDLTANAKLVYTHMLDKYVFFARQDKPYHENMKDIAEELGLSKQTVSDCIKRLAEVGLVIIQSKKVYATAKSVISYSYIVKDVYKLYVPAKVLQITKNSKIYDDDSPF